MNGDLDRQIEEARADGRDDKVQQLENTKREREGRVQKPEPQERAAPPSEESTIPPPIQADEQPPEETQPEGLIGELTKLINDPDCPLEEAVQQILRKYAKKETPPPEQPPSIPAEDAGEEEKPVEEPPSEPPTPSAPQIGDDVTKEMQAFGFSVYEPSVGNSAVRKKEVYWQTIRLDYNKDNPFPKYVKNYRYPIDRQVDMTGSQLRKLIDQAFTINTRTGKGQAAYAWRIKNVEAYQQFKEYIEGAHPPVIPSDKQLKRKIKRTEEDAEIAGLLGSKFLG